MEEKNLSRHEALNSLLDFSKMLTEFQKVTRVVRVQSEDRWENDVEHSFMLAMQAWHIIESRKLSLDVGLVLKYALVHDLAEVYAGDTYIYSENQEELDSKEHREREARERLSVEFPEFAELHRLMEWYEERTDPESRFVYALDKVQPVIHIYLDGGRTWREKAITLKMLVEHKKDKVILSPEVWEYWSEFVDILKKDEERLFGGK